MIKKYLIVNKKILPDVYEKVIVARNMINEGSAKGISEAVKKVGISRSTYYKYKDYVFSPSENSIGRIAVIALILKNEKRILSNVINEISKANANILTINQNIPINGKASVNLSLDVSDIEPTIEEMLSKLKNTLGVCSAKLIAIE